jgi:hypothetical protein
MVNLEIFRALCLKVADEQDPKKLELLKQRMRILLQENPDVTNAGRHHRRFVAQLIRGKNGKGN